MSRQRQVADAIAQGKHAKAMRILSFRLTSKTDIFAATLVRTCGLIVEDALKSGNVEGALESLKAFADMIMPKGFGSVSAAPLHGYGTKCPKCEGQGKMQPRMLLAGNTVRYVGAHRVQCPDCKGKGYTE